MKRISMIGRKFRHLIVTECAYRKGPNLYYHCLCDCGRKTTVRGYSLRSGNISSCGCAQWEATTTHGRSRTPEHNVWMAMKARCTRPSQANYYKYGGRGIRVCDEWMSNFQAFYDHIGPKPSSRHQIDRIDNDGNYEPGNVRWVTPQENRHNRRDSKKKES